MGGWEGERGGGGGGEGEGGGGGEGEGGEGERGGGCYYELLHSGHVSQSMYFLTSKQPDKSSA